MPGNFIFSIVDLKFSGARFLCDRGHVFHGKKTKTENYRKLKFPGTQTLYLIHLTRSQHSHSPHSLAIVARNSGREFASFHGNQIERHFMHFAHPIIVASPNTLRVRLLHVAGSSLVSGMPPGHQAIARNCLFSTSTDHKRDSTIS